MSTRSCIIVKVSRNDIGKTIKFDAKKTPTKSWEETWRDESSKEKSKPIKLEKGYIGIYCHWDGYFEYVGKLLKENYNDYEKALNLVSGGFCSSLEVDSIKHYANRKGEEWEYIKPILGETPKDIYAKVGHNGYVYLFEDGAWKALDEESNFSDYEY